MDIVSNDAAPGRISLTLPTGSRRGDAFGETPGDVFGDTRGDILGDIAAFGDLLDVKTEI